MTNSNALKLLTAEEIETLNLSDGSLNLDPNATYVASFLFNPERNNAGDPIPFKIAKESLMRIALTAIGKPWIPYPPDDAKHIRGAVGTNPNDAQAILRNQKQYSGGYIVGNFKKDSQNVYSIIKVYPEYVDKVLRDLQAGKISPFTSVLLNVLKEQNGEIKDAEVLHIQHVEKPGYPAEIARLTGVCSGMFGECAQELRTLGASGQLQEYQKKIGNFDYMAIHQRIGRRGERDGRVLGASSFTPSIRAALKTRREGDEKVDYLTIHERIGKRRF